MNEATIAEVLSSTRWSASKLEEAARGKVNGSCDDPPEVEMAFWLNLAISQGEDPELAGARIAEQARRGLFG